MADIYWALNEQGRLYIPNKTPELLAYDEEHRNASSFYLNEDDVITADVIPNSIDWESPYPAGIWYVQEDGKLHCGGMSDRLYWSKPYPYSMWYLNEDLGHLHDSGIPVPIIVDAFRNCTALQRIKINNSVKSIGKLSFENTILTQVKLADDCTYYSTTFPQDCVVEGGQIID